MYFLSEIFGLYVYLFITSYIYSILHQRSVVNQLKSDMEKLQEEIKAHLVSSNSPLLTALHVCVYLGICVSLQVHVSPWLLCYLLPGLSS